MLRKVLTVLNKIVRKKNHIVFNSFPAFSDNAYYVYRYIMENREDITSKYKIFWCQGKDEPVPEHIKKDGVTVLSKTSLKGLWTFLSAKYVVHTHGYFGKVKSGNGQIMVNLWHGCGYKDLLPSERGYRGDKHIVTSELYRPIHADIFDMKLEDVYATGLPRNDELFKKSNAIEKLGYTQGQFNKIVIWMPTYRKAAFGHEGIDGAVDSFGIASISTDEYLKLDAVLKEKNYLLIIKPHPMDSIDVNLASVLSNIKCYTTRELNNLGIQLYELLADTDVLLSDYSSVVVDYLLLGRPMAMVLSDIQEFKGNRGFLLDPIEDYLPGPIISDYPQLLAYFENMERMNEEAEPKRKELEKLMHAASDANSSKRVCEAIWGGEPV